MGRLLDRLHEAGTTVMSPDGNIRASAQFGNVISVEFRPGSYERYRQSDLEHQISRLATVLYTGHERAVREVKQDEGLNLIRDAGNFIDQRDKNYISKITSIEAEGSGPRDAVWLVTKGMLEWACDITDGTLEELSEDEFIDETLSAARVVLQRTAGAAALIKDEYYGLGIPELTEEREKRSRQGR